MNKILRGYRKMKFDGKSLRNAEILLKINSQRKILLHLSAIIYRVKWLEAIQKDGLTWLHVSDLKGWKNEVAKLYDVNFVPQNILIDPKGIIIAKNMTGVELEMKLVEILGIK